MFIKTFLVGLRIFFEAARAYVHRNEDGIKEHTTSPEWMAIQNAVDAITVVIDILIGSPIAALGKRVKKSDPQYQAILSNLRSQSSDDYIRIPARVMRREEYERWLSTQSKIMS